MNLIPAIHIRVTLVIKSSIGCTTYAYLRKVTSGLSVRHFNYSQTILAQARAVESCLISSRPPATFAFQFSVG